VPHLDNPAGRLYSVLTALKDQGNVALRIAWTTSLGLTEPSPPELLRAIAAVQELPDQTMLALARAKAVSSELHLRWESPVREALSRSHQLDQGAQNMTNLYSEKDLVHLEYCDDVLNREGLASPGARQARAELYEVANELVEAIRDSDLEPQIRASLLRSALALLSAITLVDVVGAEGVEDALAGVLGSIAIAGQRAGDKERWIPRFWTYVDRIGKLLSIAGVGYQIAGPYIPELSGPGHQPTP